MTITAEAPATEDTGAVDHGQDHADQVSGLTAADEVAITQAAAEVFKVCSAAAVRILTAQRPALEQRVTDAETTLGAAKADLEGPGQVLDRLNGELAECARRGDEVKLASEDESLTVRLEARSLKVAIEEETAALRERVQIATRVCDPLVVALADAERQVKTARRRLAELDEAAEFPFISDLGKRTAPHMRYMLATGAWFSSRSPEAEAIILQALRETGIGDRLQREAIEAFCAGDPVARSAGSNTHRWSDGTVLHSSPRVAPVVTHGEAGPGHLAAAPSVPTVPGPTAAEVITGIRNGFGWPKSR